MKPVRTLDRAKMRLDLSEHSQCTRQYPTGQVAFAAARCAKLLGMMRLCVLALGAAVLAGAQPPPPQAPTFRSGTQVVSLFVTVQDAQKRLVPDLTQDDFQIFDNEKPQPITYFDSSVRPITVVAMLDTSG